MENGKKNPHNNYGISQGMPANHSITYRNLLIFSEYIHVYTYKQNIEHQTQMHAQHTTLCVTFNKQILRN